MEFCGIQRDYVLHHAWEKLIGQDSDTTKKLIIGALCDGTESSIKTGKAANIRLTVGAGMSRVNDYLIKRDVDIICKVFTPIPSC